MNRSESDDGVPGPASRKPVSSRASGIVALAAVAWAIGVLLSVVYTAWLPLMILIGVALLAARILEVLVYRD